MKLTVSSLGVVAAVAQAQDITFISDPGVYGPALETAHAYYGQWPTGIAVSSTGRKFSNFPGGRLCVLGLPTSQHSLTTALTGLDPTNVYNGSNNVFTVGELTSLTEETAYPSLEMNHPPGGAINYTTNPPSEWISAWLHALLCQY